ncbi:fungal-specific transcription factor domain-containing protein [Aspergillus pseudoustus]|uniref:Fungal-specific transcription factor domain-containing protein n=1 Tax=Aspergillus pseudoustus TaxID=1810923 RepID=A0ABR4KB76_9EURO
MTPFEDTSQYTPSVIKSCARCRARKVKCDLKVPHCSACQKHGEPCNITEYVAYPYSLVASLHSKVKELEQKLQSYPGQLGPDSSSARLGDAHTQLDNSERPIWSVDVSKEAEEVGVLAIGSGDRYSEKKYVGAAAGSTFARIFFKQVGLSPSSDVSSRFEYQDDALVSMASMPTKIVSARLLSVYIARIHLWWPFMNLRYIRGCFQQMYQKPRETQNFERFIFFIVLALASDKARQGHPDLSMLDLNSPPEYFQTALRYFTRFHDHPRDLPGLQAVLLLTLWMLNSVSCNHGNDLWHLTRYAMSVALELGIHRHNPSWNFSPEELELRSRTWWSVYNLERFIALASGRVLSVRDQAIDTPLPSFISSLDQLSSHEAKAAPLFHSKSVWTFTQVIELRQIAGRILESTYIARDQHGRCKSLSFQDLCYSSDELHRQLDKWKAGLDVEEISSYQEYKILKIEYHMLLLHLNRPSPAFMIPSQHMIAVCSHASSNALRHMAELSAEDGIEAVCRCYRHFHDILMIGLARLYCDWYTQRITPAGSTPTLRPEDAAICFDLLGKGITVLRHPPLSKFLNLFSALKAKIYPASYNPSTGGMEGSAAQIHSTRGEEGLFDNPSDMMEEDGARDFGHGHNFENMILSGPDGLETYLNQVSTIFDNELFNLDDSLTAWYGSVLDDIGNHENTR